MTCKRTIVLWILALLLAGGPAYARKPDKRAKPGDKARAAESKEDEDEDDPEDRKLLLKSIVKSATKTETTIEEAPAVIHVLTAEDLSAFGYRHIIQPLLFVPGFLEVNSQYDQVPGFMALGVVQGVLYLRDGISMFDPMYNAPATMRRVPLENVKRIEAMTSPGGVLWGANSFLGIVNVMTKDPEDVNGFEMGLGGGTGRGDEQVIRPYGMYGKTFFKGRLGVFVHWSLEWFKGPQYSVPEPWVVSSASELMGPTSYRYPGGLSSQMPTSFYSQFDGKIRYQNLKATQRITLGWQVAFHKMPNLIESARKKKWVFWDGIHRPIGFWGVPLRTDSPNPAIQSSSLNWHDTYVWLHYAGKYLKNRLGLDAKAYYTQFERKMDPFVYLPYTNDLIPGVAANNSATAHRSGITLDFNAALHRKFQLLFGGEVFYEWVKDATSEFVAPIDGSGQINFSLLRIVGCRYWNRHGDNIPVYDSNNPANTTYLPGCQTAFVFDADRLVYAGYLAAQYKPHKTLGLSGGVRIQHSPAGNVPYDPWPLYSAAAVWNFYKDLYLKVNFATGFRPPVFNATSANVKGGNYAGDPNLKPEESRSIKAEINAKLIKNRNRIRQWTLRLNYSYTELIGVIRVIGGTYANSDTRAIHATEFHSDLVLTGGHRLVLSYTYVRQHGDASLDGGLFRSVPNHWFAGGAVFRLLDLARVKLDLNLTARIIGPFEDPNQAMICPAGSQYCTSRVSDRAYDRIHPAAELNAGLRLQLKLKRTYMEVTANFYNMLDGKNYASDEFYDLSADVEKLSSPNQRFYFFLQAKLRYQ
ncbi:MAG: TonB-dependent receptor [bacterium]